MLIDFNIPGVSSFGTPLPFDSQLEKKFSYWLPDWMKNVAQVRQQEYIAGRYCAYEAAKLIGVDLKTLPSALTREAIWPQGVFGSITHSKKMAISCVSISEEFSSVGIDAEDIIKLSLSLEVETMIATEEELALLDKLEYQNGITVLFSAKEALYKALFPLARTFIDFKEVKLTSLDVENGSFELELLSPHVRLASYLGRYKGFFKQMGDTIVTVVSVPKTTTRGNCVHS